jgi:hypothetical protein
MQIETTRTPPRAGQTDWTINVVGLTSEEAMAISGFVSQLIVKRAGGFENLGSGGTVVPATFGDRVVAKFGATIDGDTMSGRLALSRVLVKALTPEPLTKPTEPGNRFSGLDLSSGSERDVN